MRLVLCTSKVHWRPELAGASSLGRISKANGLCVSVRHVLNVVFAILAVIAVVMVVTSIVQALQLRKQNLLTMQCLGCSRFRVNCLLLTELSILVSGALMLSIILVVILESTAPSLLTLI